MNENLYKAAGGLVAALVLVTLVNAFLGAKVEREAESPPPPPANLHASDEYGISFTVPDGMFVWEGAGETATGTLAVVLAEDNPTNRDFAAGRGPEGTEGPPLVRIQAYPNPDRLGVAEWAQRAVGWESRTGEDERVQVAGHDGVAFRWSGLYEGKTAVVTRDQYAYAFSVEWVTPEDRQALAFDELLNSVVLR